MLGYQLNGKPEIRPIDTFKSEANFTRPESIDWREKGAVFGVKNQGQCGSCWAFSTTGGLEGQLAIHHKQYIPLSEQELVACDKDNYACVCGWIDVSYAYVQQIGLSSEEQYPYLGQGTSVGPISIYVNANDDWQLYGGGVFDDIDCDDLFFHAVLITGYDSQSWTIKNSWGTGWGEEGYIRLIRGKSQCDVTVFPIYLVL
ncbi:cathepsin K-like [Diorhabda sublineata]|uniref:cathepsin K-like n=1 Tax=Diorhabda sublineata TaxID=1163346 RepID=UPI0024E17104|nr:cathepsin K-like [Diorhabda sublineata]